MKNLFLTLLISSLVFSPFFSSAEIKGKDKIPFEILIIISIPDLPVPVSVISYPEIKASYCEDIVDFSINMSVGPIEVSVINRAGLTVAKSLYFTAENNTYSIDVSGLNEGEYILKFYMPDYHKLCYQGSFTK